MRAYDIISKKKRGLELSREEIFFFTEGYTLGSIPDYQASALLMAICFSGMSDRETRDLTEAIASSGDQIDLSEFGTLSVDKHSTGGVGDKTTLIVTPIAAALGCKVAKMSGRGLGHTGGTVDKLESIPGYRTSLSPKEFSDQVKNIGISVVGQSGNFAPADKKIYALRDVTATVDSIPLITSSIMGKKIAAGAHSIVLDVKCGSGAFTKTEKDAEELAQKMVDIGKLCGRNTAAVITDMDIPLGYAVGNILEVKEAIKVLKGEGPLDLLSVSLELASLMAHLSLGISIDEARLASKEAILSGAAFSKFKDWISAQGADSKYADNTSLFETAKFEKTITAESCGYISHMNAEIIGAAAVALGAGRKTKEDYIDFTAGILLNRKTSEKVDTSDVIATLYSNSEDKLSEGAELFKKAISFSDEKPEKRKLIYKTVI